MIDLDAKVTPLEEVEVVKEFLDVFLDDLTQLPPDRELKFAIDLIPRATPMSKASYRMTPVELKELQYHPGKANIMANALSWKAETVSLSYLAVSPELVQEVMLIDEILLYEGATLELEHQAKDVQQLTVSLAALQVEKGLKGLEVQWQTTVVSTGIVAAAAGLPYLCYTRREGREKKRKKRFSDFFAGLKVRVSCFDDSDFAGLKKCATKGGPEFFFIVNIQVPGSTTYSPALHYMMSTPIEESPLLDSFIKGDDSYRNSRFKLIPYISKLGIDIGSSTVARGLVSLVLGYLNNLVIEMAFLIQVRQLCLNTVTKKFVGSSFWCNEVQAN
ncbi:uncharacterized protein LOC122091549 [Macadamia integrifolia]|uniref:uncharacterized protein LOC122091549 n=1 Tax=Macadamia integrifolia TaxID=60698 RepID=UPI001C4E4E1C|nr:uncharacterized protein LOC122091549 [Macadamia integrifolia]